MFQLLNWTIIAIIVFVIILIEVVKFLIALAIFKWKCSIQAEIIAERIREELDDVIDNLEIKMN